MGFGDTLFYPDPTQRAAIVCSRIIRNHPLPEDETADVIEALAASQISEEAFIQWVKARTKT